MARPIYAVVEHAEKERSVGTYKKQRPGRSRERLGAGRWMLTAGERGDLPGRDEGLPRRLGQLDRDEVGGGIQVVLSRLVHDADEALPGSVLVGEHLVHLPRLQVLAAIVPDAEGELRGAAGVGHLAPSWNCLIFEFLRPK
jgi:hypothetical protein